MSILVTAVAAAVIVMNFCDNACILLNYDCKFAPNTSNLVERYYADWDAVIRRFEGEISK